MTNNRSHCGRCRAVRAVRGGARPATEPTGAGTLNVGTDDGQKNENAHVASGHYGRANEPRSTDSGPKTEIGVDETAQPQTENGLRSGERGLVHETANGQWSEKAG